MIQHALSEAELQRWLYLRAIEWSSWPLFVTQPIIPALLVFFPLIFVLGALIVTDVLWRFVRYSFVSPALAKTGASFVMFAKWPSAIGAAIYLCVHHRYGLAILALLWPFVAAFVAMPASMIFAAAGHPTRVGHVELELAKRIGYVPRNAAL